MIAKAVDIEAARFSAPDLATMRKFLLDFGLRDAQDAGDGILRMRGTSGVPFLHETVEGAPGFIGMSIQVRSLDDLKALAAAESSVVEPARGPGGGHEVELRDPDGFRVVAVAGRTDAALHPHGSRDPWNVVARRERSGTAKRVAAGPASVVRLGHVVMNVSDLKRSWDWWSTRFGLITSDEVRAPNGDLAALFIRCDRGAELADHHTLNFASIPGVPPKFHHAAFEVADFDDLMAGNRHLLENGYTHDWGVGRHVLGSQVFDYWKDPWGNRVEHWTDGDMFDATAPTTVTDIPTMLGHQWGPAAPADFVV